MFIWTGFDYLGEPTPYGWPSRSSYFGIMDLAGFPKDVFYMYKSEWTDEPVLHLFPHWNWEPGEEVDMKVYTNCDTVELFLNGESLGAKYKPDTALHLMWTVRWEPGEIVAKGHGPGGKVLQDKVATAGPAARLEVLPDRSAIKADGQDLSFITVNVLDSAGNLVPFADNLITCLVEGAAEIAGTDNGNPVSHEPFQTNFRKAFNGKCLFVVKSAGKPGEVKLEFASEGLPSKEIYLELE
jgi:beta-galactosidase